MSLRETPAADISGSMGLAAGKRGVTAVNDGDGGGFRGGASDVIEPGLIGNDVVVGKIEEVLDDEMVAGFRVCRDVSFVRVQLGVVVSGRTLEKFGIFHWEKRKFESWGWEKNAKGVCVRES